ncbi:MAG: hypothetical protein K1X71_03645 [Pirellulales bacterium]|nr:hypothetical protein [Pirellulales bacterium]
MLRAETKLTDGEVATALAIAEGTFVAALIPAWKDDAESKLRDSKISNAARRPSAPRIDCWLQIAICGLPRRLIVITKAWSAMLARWRN